MPSKLLGLVLCGVVFTIQSTGTELEADAVNDGYQFFECPSLVKDMTDMEVFTHTHTHTHTHTRSVKQCMEGKRKEKYVKAKCSRAKSL